MVLNVPCSWWIACTVETAFAVRGKGMNFRTAGALATLLLAAIGSADPAAAQYYPAPQAYPPQSYPPARGYPPYRPAPVVDEDDDGPLYDPPMVQRSPLPPLDAPQANDPRPQANVGGGRAPHPYPDQDSEPLPPPPGYFYGERPRGSYEPSPEPGTRVARPTYAPPPAGAPPGVSPALPPVPAPMEPDGV